ncbi:MAG: co-chaperone GroES family protein [Chitinophagales bacterium]|nr:co-chaperone GroES family protein [Chitinophagales bacterium]
MNLFQEDLSKIILIGDKVLIRPKTSEVSTKSGLILPANIIDQEPIASGYIIKVGPGYPLPHIDEHESWKPEQGPKYLPLQVEAGDLAVYMQKHGYEIEFNDTKYVLVSHSAVLMVIRDELI